MNDQLDIFKSDPGDNMTVKEVAFALSVSERTIQRYVKKIFPDIPVERSATLLSQEQVTMIKLDLEKNKHLDNAVELPKTDLEKKLLIKQAMSFLNEEIEELKGQLEQAKPAIEFHNQVGDSTGLHTVAEVAKMLGTGRDRFFTWLRSENLLRDNNEPYQRYIESGYFKVKESPNNKHVNSQTFVTPKGLTWLQAKRGRK